MTESKDLYLIDSNILVYAFEKEDSPKKDKAKELLNECIFGTRVFALSNQNLAEFVFAATKKGKLSIEEAKNLVIKMNQFEGLKKINYNTRTILLALSIMEESGAPFWDSLLAATMRENGIFNIYTENDKHFKMHWIKAVNPFS